MDAQKHVILLASLLVLVNVLLHVQQVARVTVVHIVKVALM